MKPRVGMMVQFTPRADDTTLAGAGRLAALVTGMPDVEPVPYASVALLTVFSLRGQPRVYEWVPGSHVPMPGRWNPIPGPMYSIDSTPGVELGPWLADDPTTKVEGWCTTCGSRIDPNARTHSCPLAEGRP